MPLTPDSPADKDVPGPAVSKSLNKMHIHDFRVVVDPNGAAGSKISLHVKWSEGYVESDVYHVVHTYQQSFSGQDLEDELDEATGGGTFYNEIKDKLWNWLQTQGFAPAGTIS